MTKTFYRLTQWLFILASLFLLTAMTDPTRPPDVLLPASSKGVVAGSLQLTAIFVYPDRRIAVINGKEVRTGDTINEYTIINIQHDTVELKGSQGNLTVLTLFPQIKQVRAN
jgi:hypothetical protein